MSSKAAFDPHLAVFEQVRKVLERAGFCYEDWSSSAVAVPEIPRPALMFVGNLAGVDLGERTANFPHPIELERFDAYCSMLDHLRRERAASRGRPLSRYWEEFAPARRTCVGAIFTPMRQGYYGVPRGRLAIGYHAAEFAYLISCLEPGSELVIERDSFYVELDGHGYGVLQGQLLDPADGLVGLDHEFDSELLVNLRDAPGLTLTWMRPMWRAIQAFLIKAGLTDDLDLMQAVAHCRWSLPATVTWTDRAFQCNPVGRPRLRSRARPQQLAMRVEEARVILERAPHIQIRHIRNRLVPAVMSRETWNADVAPITRSKRRRRSEVISYLRNLEESLLAKQ